VEIKTDHQNLAPCVHIKYMGKRGGSVCVCVEGGGEGWQFERLPERTFPLVSRWFILSLYKFLK